MKRTKRGISLIVLIITIIIMIVLAGTIILSLTSNDIIGNSRVAMFKNNAASYKTDLNLSLSNEMLSDNDFNKYLVNAYTLTDIQEYIPSMQSGDEENFAIQAGDLVYIGGDEEEILQMREIGIAEGFIDGVDYDQVYLNPNISMNVADIEGVDEYVNGTEGEEGFVPNIITWLSNGDILMLVKKASILETEQPLAMIMIVEANVPFAVYNFESGTLEEDGETITLPKGWLKVEEDVPIIMTDEEIAAIDFDLGDDLTSSGRMGHEFLHYYFSTVAY